MPMIPKLAFINRKPPIYRVVMLRNARRYFRLFARSIANLLRLPHPASFRIKSTMVIINFSRHR